MKQNSVKIIGITGGVGSGKSRVLEYLAGHWDAYVIQADLVAHEQMAPGTKCHQEILAHFGSEVVGAAGALDRQRLGSIVFADSSRLQQLNRIVHPAVKQAIQAEIQQQLDQKQIIVVEAALLIEDHYNEICDELWYVYAREQQRRQWLKTQRGYTDERITEIMGQQLSDQQFRRHCDFVLDNNGSWERTKHNIDEKMINLLR